MSKKLKRQQAKEGTCALCRRIGELRKSHILPQFLYRKVFDGGTMGQYISTTSGERIQTRPTGVYERLLCGRCEGRFCDWETYAQRVLYGDTFLPAPAETAVGLLFRDVDYVRFKLFQLSLLWRAAVSKREEFRWVNLSKGRREKLRLMLLNGNPGLPREFGCIVLAVPSIMDKVEDLVQMPHYLRTPVGPAFRFVMGGMFWIFRVPNAEPAALRARAVISSRRELHVLINEQHGMEYYNRLTRALAVKILDEQSRALQGHSHLPRN